MNVIEEIKAKIEKNLERISFLQKEIDVLFSENESMKAKIYNNVLPSLDKEFSLDGKKVDIKSIYFIDSYNVLYEGRVVDATAFVNENKESLKQIVIKLMANS